MSEGDDGMKETHLVQQTIDDMAQANNIFGQPDEDGNLPLVLIPFRCCCSLWMEIPEDVHVIMHRWGADIGADAPQLTPGLHFPLWPWYTVAFLVTKQSCVYNCPVKNCPTSDNVMVQVDVVVVFMINNPRHFVYKLGPLKFGALLKAATEESIRGLVRETSHDKVIDLRGSKARGFLSSLNLKFDEFGVTFQDATIKRVVLPEKLEATLEEKTTYDSKQRQAIKEHVYNLQVLNDGADLELRRAAAENERALHEELAKKERALILKQQQEIKAQEQKQVAIIRGEEQAETLLYQAQSDLQNAVIQGQRTKDDMILQAQGEFEATKIMVDKYAEVQATKAKTALTKARNRAKALIVEAEAEQKAAEQLKIKREYDLAMRKLDVLRKLARNGRVVISGANADSFIKELMIGVGGDS